MSRSYVVGQRSGSNSEKLCFVATRMIFQPYLAPCLIINRKAWEKIRLVVSIRPFVSFAEQVDIRLGLASSANGRIKLRMTITSPLELSICQ